MGCGCAERRAKMKAWVRAQQAKRIAAKKEKEAEKEKEKIENDQDSIMAIHNNVRP